LIRELKRDSSKWIKDENPRLSDFYWQQGYGAFSVSPSHVDALIKYIDNQEELAVTLEGSVTIGIVEGQYYTESFGTFYGA